MGSLPADTLELLAAEVQEWQRTGRTFSRHVAVLVRRLQTEAGIRDESVLARAEELVRQEVLRRWLAQRSQRPVPLVESDPGPGGEHGGDVQIGFDNRCGVRGRVESRLGRRGAREIEISIRSPSLDGGTPAQARELAYTLLCASDAAEMSAQDIRRREEHQP